MDGRIADHAGAGSGGMSGPGSGIGGHGCGSGGGGAGGESGSGGTGNGSGGAGGLGKGSGPPGSGSGGGVGRGSRSGSGRGPGAGRGSRSGSDDFGVDGLLIASIVSGYPVPPGSFLRCGKAPGRARAWLWERGCESAFCDESRFGGRRTSCAAENRRNLRNHGRESALSGGSGIGGAGIVRAVRIAPGGGGARL